MDITEAELADQIEASAYYDMYQAAPSGLALKAERLGPAVLLCSPRLPITMFNRVIGLERASDPDAALKEVMGRYTAVGITKYWIHVGDTASDTLLSSLAQHGFRPAARKRWAKMLISEPPRRLATSLKLKRAEAADAPELSQVILRAHGMPSALAGWIEALVDRPGWHAYSATENGKIVAGGFLHMHDARGWLGMGGTLAEYRRLGAQGALMALRVRAAQASGCTVVETETGEPGNEEELNPSFANMGRCGFRQVASRRNFESPGA